MAEKNLIGIWIRRFFQEHLVAERNLAYNTQASYRDTFALLLPFAAATVKRSVDRLCIDQLSAEVVRLFLQHLEQARGCSVVTRNQRLAAIHALARFIAERSPEHVAWCTEVRGIPFKRSTKSIMTYLEKPEVDALLDLPNRSVAQGLRDYAVLLFLYNTGARADETAHVTVADLGLDRSPSVRLHGKGNKTRLCPLWALTAKILASLVSGRPQNSAVFLNCRGEAMTRFGIHAVVKRYVLRAQHRMPSLRSKRVSAHTIRHTTAVHLLRAGVDINTIRAWLGHVSLDTTHIYAEVDFQMKAKALAHCEIMASAESTRNWRAEKGLMDFLKSL